jgi:hypothetical protein
LDHTGSNAATTGQQASTVMVSSHTERSRPATTKSQPTPPATILVAIDVAKLRNEVLVELPDGRRRRRMTVTNTRAEHDRLVGPSCTLCSAR